MQNNYLDKMFKQYEARMELLSEALIIEKKLTEHASLQESTSTNPNEEQQQITINKLRKEVSQLTEKLKKAQEKNDNHLQSESLSRIKELQRQIETNRGEYGKDINIHYQAAPRAVNVQKLSQMKGIEKYIFIIREIIRWIGDGLVSILTRIVQFISSLTGTKFYAEIKKNKNYFEKEIGLVKELEYNIIDQPSFEKSLKGIGLDDAIVRQYTVHGQIDYDTMRVALKESFSTYGEKFNNDVRTTQSYQGNTTVISFDLSRDLKRLKVMLEGYYKLYDNTIGSYGENLFSVEEIEQILAFYESAYNNLEAFSTDNKFFRKNNYSISNIENTFETIENTISIEKLKRALVLTNENVRNLSRIYDQIQEKVKQILNIIVATQAQLFGQMDTRYLSIFTQATYNEFLAIADAFEYRIKELQAQEVKIRRVQERFANLIKSFNKTNNSFAALLGNNAYTYTAKEGNVFDKLKEATTLTFKLTQQRFEILSRYLETMVVLQKMIDAAAGASKLKS